MTSPADSKSQTLLRGRLLSFTSEPADLSGASYQYVEDGALLIQDGRIIRAGDFGEVITTAEPGHEVIDHRPHLIMPGFIDTHLHFPQTQVIASWGTQLLDWLNTYTFPEESKYADPGHSARMADFFLDLLVDHGTTTAAVFASVHVSSVDALFSAADHRNMGLIAGKVMMDRNAPDGVLDTAQSSYDETIGVIDKWHGKGRQRVAITPRFAITSTPQQLAAAGIALKEHPDCYLQTHLSENHDEIELTKKLYPEARDYLDVYESNGLLGPKSLFGHCIHLEPREIGRCLLSHIQSFFGQRPV
jgi:guanine deaminase